MLGLAEYSVAGIRELPRLSSLLLHGRACAALGRLLAARAHLVNNLAPAFRAGAAPAGIAHNMLLYLHATRVWVYTPQLAVDRIHPFDRSRMKQPTLSHIFPANSRLNRDSAVERHCNL